MDGPELRSYRETVLKLTSHEFARAIGMKESNVGSQVRGWERGYRAIPGPVQTILQLAQDVPGVFEWLRRRSGCFVDEAAEDDAEEDGGAAGDTTVGPVTAPGQSQ